MNTNFIENKSPLIIAAGVMGIALFLSAIVIGSGISSKNANNSVSSTGSAKMHVTADNAKVGMEISRRVGENEMKAGYARLAADSEVVKKFLTSQGLVEKDYTLSSPFVSEVWNQDNNAPRRFDIKQNMTVQSLDIQKVKQVADGAARLVSTTDVMIQVYNVEYYYSKLAEARVSLLGDAIKDAKARATEIAKSSGNRVGKLRSASSGVVQVLSPNSVNVEDYGSYDTSTVEKDIMVTVKASFEVK
jgi:hypothetical protein